MRTCGSYVSCSDDADFRATHACLFPGRKSASGTTLGLEVSKPSRCSQEPIGSTNAVMACYAWICMQLISGMPRIQTERWGISPPLRGGPLRGGPLSRRPGTEDSTQAKPWTRASPGPIASLSPARRFHWLPRFSFPMPTPRMAAAPPIPAAPPLPTMDPRRLQPIGGCPGT